MLHNFPKAAIAGLLFFTFSVYGASTWVCADLGDVTGGGVMGLWNALEMIKSDPATNINTLKEWTDQCGASTQQCFSTGAAQTLVGNWEASFGVHYSGVPVFKGAIDQIFVNIQTQVEEAITSDLPEKALLLVATMYLERAVFQLEHTDWGDALTLFEEAEDKITNVVASLQVDKYSMGITVDEWVEMIHSFFQSKCSSLPDIFIAALNMYVEAYFSTNSATITDEILLQMKCILEKVKNDPVYNANTLSSEAIFEVLKCLMVHTLTGGSYSCEWAAGCPKGGSGIPVNVNQMHLPQSSTTFIANHVQNAIRHSQIPSSTTTSPYSSFWHSEQNPYMTWWF